jgi:hypothetical protein
LIVLVSHSDDEHTRRVIAELERLGATFFLLDTGAFPARSSLRMSFSRERVEHSMSVGGRDVGLSSARSAWWRRPQPYQLDGALAQDMRDFAHGECHEAMAGLWGALDVAWMNPPGADERAHHKPYQLAVARAVGLDVPRTLITNDPEAAREFASAVAPTRLVYKTFLATERHWRETRILGPQEWALLDRVRLAPVIFQEFVDAEADLRVTAVGETLVAAQIASSAHGYLADYRMDMDAARFSPTELPDSTRTKLLELMARLGLVYGAIDLRRRSDGSYVFLEVNPAGEWLFVEERTGQLITRAVAECLVALGRP